MHGGAKGSGAPRGNRNALKHGFYTRDAIAARRTATQMLKEMNEFLSDLEAEA